ncbi:PhoD-like phosphatase-domain-containing protein [Dichomitus squalens]|uniref:PhoD-like phosphatase-domain-containing protein n=1 Tax=Dichomitus squalens TaxID=114155 RepID=A0A4Q9Q0M6_9APHY|nr:PhoD-like phosphatase-domain-containing protein [Dichomitus squalens]TBU60707.1 PhoD-like phosphatase-domain-containing protein [Dichomitus squalens]
MSATLATASSAVSTLYRIVVYLFLQVVPKSEAKWLIPILYILYVATSYFSTPLFNRVAVVKEEIVAVQEEKPEENGDIVTDVAVVETTAVVSVPEPLDWKSALSTVIFSVPSPVRALRLANLAINTILLFAVIEFLAVPYFDDASGVVYTRVGALTPDAAKIVVRYPPSANSTENLVRLSYRQVKSSPQAWREGPIANLTAENDWVQTVRLTGLWPTTTYEYRFEDVNDANITVLPYPAEPIRFRTFPDSRLHSGSHFRFIASSCMTPNFPYAPLQARRIKGLDLLADYLWPSKPEAISSSSPLVSSLSESVSSTVEAAATTSIASSENTTSPAPASDVIPPVAATAVEKPAPPTEFMVFMGDFIYADVPVYFGNDIEAYRRLYRRNYNSPSFRKVYERLPIFHTYDDHEIINNFVGQGNSSQEPFPNAADAFSLYNANANYDSPAEGQYYYDFRYGDAAFFVLDTRRYRSDITSEDPTTHTMLGDQQLGALYNWLGKVNNTAVFKFIVTSVPFTSLWTHDALTDSWAGFPVEKATLLSALQSVPNVILLSGDRHEFAAIEYESGDHGHNVLEISTSPMSMFYVPFIRTLRPRSEEVVNKTVEEVLVAEDGTKEVLQYVVEVPKEKVIKYIGEGNYKWSSIEVDTRDPQHPVVRVEIMIDGKPAYHLEVLGKPVKLQISTSIGALVPQSFKGMLDKIGIKPSKWF